MTKLKLNLGSGFKKRAGYVNVDCFAECKPDVVFDLEQTPWPWPESSVEEIRLDHVLEHLGKDAKTYLNIWKELWRVSAPDAKIFIVVPHWRHENFAHDPTHVRPVTPVGVAMFDQARNREDEKRGGQETKLGLLLGIDFEIEDVEYVFVPEITLALASGKISREKVASLLEHENNVCQEIKMRVRVRK